MENKEFWFVVGSQFLYGPEVLDTVAERAAEMAGLEALPAVVREMTYDEAVIAMVDANIQRENVLPSEKAFAYKMKSEAMIALLVKTFIVGGTSIKI